MAVRKDKQRRGWIADVHYYKENGQSARKRSKKGFKTKAEALEDEISIRQNINQSNNQNHLFIVVANEFITFKARRNSKKLTIDRYNVLLKKIEEIHYMMLEDIKVNNLMILQDKLLDSGLSSNYINDVFTFIKSVFKYANNYLEIGNNPAIKMEPLPRHKQKDILYLTLIEFKLLEQQITDDYNYRVFVNFLFYTGVRIGEAMALTWKDLNIENSSVSISKTIANNQISTPKNESSNRKILIHQEMVDMLLELKKMKQNISFFKDCHFIFGSDKLISSQSFRNKLKLYSKMAKIDKNITHHDFRHSHATYLLNNNINIMAVSKRLGHSNINTTLKIYAHILDETAKEVVSFLEKE